MERKYSHSTGYALLCVQRGLLDVVTADLRAVVMTVYEDDERYLCSQFYYNGAVSEDDIEQWNAAITEASAGMGVGFSIHDKIERCDFPKPIPFVGPSAKGGFLAFLRWEPGASKPDPARIFPLTQAKDLAPFPEAYALLAASNALLGKVTLELRAVTVAVPQGSTFLQIQFFHDGEIKQEMAELWKAAASEIHACMGDKYSSDLQIIRMDFPQKISISQGRYAYFRKEPR